MLSKKISKGIGSVIVASVMIASALGIFPMLANGVEDTTPPVTTLMTNPENPLPWGWYITNVTITLTASDAVLNASGISKTEYKLNEGAWQTYSGPFVIDGPGTYNIAYRSTDNAENTEESNYHIIKIANTSSALTVTPISANWNTTATITVNNAVGDITIYPPRMATSWLDIKPGPYAPWSNVLFNVSGEWWVVDSGAHAKAITVNPLAIVVSATPGEVNYTKFGVAGSYITINGTATMNGAAATQATVKLYYPDDTTSIATVLTTGIFHFYDINIGQKGAGEYNITAFIGSEEYPDAFGYDIATVNKVEPNITKVSNDAVGGFDIGMVSLQVTHPEDGAALLANWYNLSIYDDENTLYAWYVLNDTHPVTHGPVHFSINGKLLNITSNLWEAGDYTIKVWVDVTMDGNWEYAGEIDYTIAASPAVTLKILDPADKTLDVLEAPDNDQIIQIQIFGANMTTYGNLTNLDIGSNMENVTKRIKIEGAILYTPPKEAYTYLGDGKWRIEIFPTTGTGTITVTVNWPEKTVASSTITTVKGGIITVTPTQIIVDTPTQITVNVKDRQDPANYYANAKVSLYYESGGSLYVLDGLVVNGTKSGNGTSGNGQQGNYVFTISSIYADRNIIVVAEFQPPAGEVTYAYGRILSQPAHDLDAALAPIDVLAGEQTKFIVNVTKGNASYNPSTGIAFQFYVLNETELDLLHNGTLDLSAYTPFNGANANGTFMHYITETGTYYLYIRTNDKKHDNMNTESSFEVTKATVTTTPNILVKNVDKNVTMAFTVKWQGQPQNGTLYIHGLGELSSYHAYMNTTVTLTIVNGEANLTNVTAVAVGNITFKFKPKTENSVVAEADGTARVTTPTIEILEPTAKVIFLAEENLITIQAKHPRTNSGIKDLEVAITTPTNPTQAVIGTTDASGKITFGIVPLQTGKLNIYVDNELAGNIDIQVALKIVAPSTIKKGENTTIIVTTSDGKPVAGATVKVDGTTISTTTNANGEVAYKFGNEGTTTITASKTGYYTATKTISVKKEDKGETPGFEFVGIAIALVLIALILSRKRR